MTEAEEVAEAQRKYDAKMLAILEQETPRASSLALVQRWLADKNKGPAPVDPALLKKQLESVPFAPEPEPIPVTGPSFNRVEIDGSKLPF